MFRPCIDLHDGKVKQIVGPTLEQGPGRLQTNYVSEHPGSWFAELYRRDGLKGGHVVMLGPGNEEAARSALQAYPGGLQVGGGITPDNARTWLQVGASHVIVTSWLFRDGKLDRDRLAKLVAVVGKHQLVLDLSCRRINGEYWVVTDRFKTVTATRLSREALEELANSCSEFLIHAIDVEGSCRGIDRELVGLLGEWTPIPTTYAGGAKSFEDLETVTNLGAGRLDLTIGSALDIFGGKGIRYQDAVAFNRRCLAR